MATVNGKKVTMTKGDTAILSIDILDGAATYTPQEGDTIRFALKKDYSDGEPLILKNIPISTMELRIDPEDTKPLDAGQKLGHYVYDIEITKADGTVNTVIPRGQWIILEEVY